MKSRWILSALALGAFAVLVGLGTWQVQRLQWKTALIEKMSARSSEAARTVEEILALREAGEDIDFRTVRVSGTFDHARAVRVYAIGGGKPGWNIFTPLRIAERRYVFVNRGFVPGWTGEPEPELYEPQGIVRGDGIVRVPPSSKSFFTPANQPHRREFYWRDYSNMVASIHDKMDVSFVPFFLDQHHPRGEWAPLTWPRPGLTHVKLSNRHLEYAITWYGLALALVGVYAFLMFGGRRRDNGETSS